VTKPEKTKLGYLPMISSLTYFVALDQGYFVDRGLDIQGIPIQTSNGIASSLETGDIEVAVELAVVPLINRLKPDGTTRPPFLIFSTSSITADNGFDGIIVAKDSPITSLSELAGKKVAVFPGTTAAKTLIDVFERKHPNAPVPIAMPMSPSLHLNSALSGEVDAVHAYEPYLSVGLKTRGMRRVQTSLYAEQVSPSPIGVAAVNRAWYERSPEIAAKILAALDDATRFIAAYPDKARMIMTRYTETDIEVAKVMNIMPMSPSNEIDKKNLNTYLIRLKEIGEIPFIPEVEAICIPVK